MKTSTFVTCVITTLTVVAATVFTINYEARIGTQNQVNLNVINKVEKPELTKQVITKQITDLYTPLEDYYRNLSKEELLLEGLVKDVNGNIKDAPGWIGYGSAMGSRLISEDSKDALEHTKQNINEEALDPIKVKQATEFYQNDLYHALVGIKAVESVDDAVKYLKVSGALNLNEFINIKNTNPKLFNSKLEDKQAKEFVISDVTLSQVISVNENIIILITDNTLSDYVMAKFDTSFKESLMSMTIGDKIDLVCDVINTQLVNCKGLQNRINKYVTTISVTQLLAGDYWKDDSVAKIKKYLRNNYK